ncbi:MAG: DUF1127 domain-containing protein [Devosia sp.]
MALGLSGERQSAAASLNPVHIVATWFAKTRTEWAQRQALTSLLDLDAHRLADLGINRGDLFDALAAEHRPTRLLAERRKAHINGYLNP